MLAKSTWAVLALTCHIELFSQAHYVESIVSSEELSPLFKDVFLFHWKEESQHAVLDELEWIREDARLASSEQRDAAVDDLIALVGGVDGILQGQAAADADYFLRIVGISADEKRAVRSRRGAEGVSLAVHRLGRDPSALREGAHQPGEPGADRAHPGRARAADVCDAGAGRSGRAMTH